MVKYLLAKLVRKLEPSAVKNSHISKKVHIYGGNIIVSSSIGIYSYIGYKTQIIYANIGKYCSIGENCKIGGGEHPLNFVSTSPLFHAGKNCLKTNFLSAQFNPYSDIRIGNDVWIGQNVIIKGGVEIQDGAVIGMGSVVTKNVGAYEIWAGNPAKFIRKRFSDDEIAILEETQWWNWDVKKIERNGYLFNSIEQFCKKVKAGQI